MYNRLYIHRRMKCVCEMLEKSSNPIRELYQHENFEVDIGIAITTKMFL